MTGGAKFLTAAPKARHAELVSASPEKTASMSQFVPVTDLSEFIISQGHCNL
jgi:hypothetical protein